MTNPGNLNYLIRLMDDDSPKVRRHVAEELKKWGPGLKSEVEKINSSLSAGQTGILMEIESDLISRKLLEEWQELFKIDGYNKRLEKVFLHIAEYQNDYTLENSISDSLTRLANEFAITVSNKNPADLAEFLFQSCGFSGNHDDYSNPRNNNLGYIFQEKLGIPISLSCLYMLVGHRLGIGVEGCNLPGHFLTRVTHKGNVMFVDCFNRGRLITPKELLKSRKFNMQKFSNLIFNKVEVNVVILRIIRNLIKSHGIREEFSKESFYQKLLIKTHKIRKGSSIQQA